MNKQTLHIARTAVFIALLVIAQLITSIFSNTIITGSIVNMILVLSVMSCDIITGIAVALISPIIAKLFGIGHFWGLIPFIMLGNLTLVVIWRMLGERFNNKLLSNIIALIISSVCKFLVLYLGVSKIAVPFFLKLPEQKAAVVTSMFSYPQLLTAVIGGIFAIIILPRLKTAFSK